LVLEIKTRLKTNYHLRRVEEKIPFVREQGFQRIRCRGDRPDEVKITMAISKNRSTVL